MFYGILVVTLYFAYKVYLASYYRYQQSTLFWLVILLFIGGSGRLERTYLVTPHNDTTATIWLWIATYAMQKNNFIAGVVLYSIGYACKNQVILALPAMLLLCSMRKGFFGVVGFVLFFIAF